jgi:leucyl-tRNA synthetase
MAVPAHDQRDLDFARAFDLPVRVVVDTGGEDPVATGVATTGDGVLVNSGPYDGLRKDEAIARVVADLEARGGGKGAVNYRLRDWLLSRQRFWGAPIPIVHCGSCGEVPVPDDQLPVRLPDLRGAALKPAGTSPLGAATDWVNVDCPSCGGAATRDTDTMDTFVDSSWYFLRYCSPDYPTGPFDPDAVRDWMPVAQYVGGVEHAILHLLYSRFFTKVLHDMGMLEVSEPFAALLNQGQVINQGKAMSKSLGNGVDLGRELSTYGVDAVRLTVVFAGPPEDDIDWADVSPAGSVKYLARVARLATEVAALPASDDRDVEVDRAVARTVDEVTRLTEAQRLNVSVARFMELTTTLRKAADAARSGLAARRRRGARRDARLLRALHRRGGLVAARARRRGGRLRARGRLAGRRPCAAGAGDGHLRGAGGGQAPRPDRGAARHRRGRAARPRAGVRAGAEGAGRPRGEARGRARAEARQRRPGLSRSGAVRSSLRP